MKKNCMKYLSLLIVAFVVIFICSPAKASIVYDSSTDLNGVGGWNCFENGDQITLAGTNRMLTDFSFYYSNITAGTNPYAILTLQSNDGIDGKPNTVLYNSGQLALQKSTGNFSYILSGLNIKVPDTFTWSVRFGDNPNNNTGNGDGNTIINVNPYSAYLRTSGSTAVGSSENFSWYYDSYAQEWIKDNKTTSYSFGANINAVPATSPSTPIPAASYLLGSGLVSLIGFWKRKRSNV